MAKLLYIESSPRKNRSASIHVAKAFLEEFSKKNPNDEIITLDLWKRELPSFDGDVIDAKYAIMHGEKYTEKQKNAWKAVEDLISEFKSVDKYVISLPMWNFGIPYILKHYIDILVQPGYTFSVSPDKGYQGLVKGKKVALIYARGGAYGSGTGAQDLDLQTRYMETILKFIGFEEFNTILVEPTLSGTKEEKEKVISKAKDQAKAVALKF